MTTVDLKEINNILGTREGNPCELIEVLQDNPYPDRGIGAFRQKYPGDGFFI